MFRWRFDLTPAGWIVVVLGTLAVAATALPIIPSNESWVRIWDFPRIQVAVLLAALLASVPFAMPIRKRKTILFACLLAAALVWQVAAILPYTPLVPPEVRATASCPPESRIRLLAANILVESRAAAPLLAQVRQMEPDLVLLVETDAWWDSALEPLVETHPHIIAHPLDNSYGIHLFSRFELVDPMVRFLVEEDVPSIKTTVLLPSGESFDLHGLHPKPPPLQDTEERDAELMIVGAEVREEGAPAIVAGDLNDVAWSHTNSLFQEISGLLDPRIGRGPYATFNANWPFLRWPLDHVFFEESFRLVHFAVLGDIGSDHFPIYVELCHDPAAAALQEQPEPEPSDIDAARDAIEEGLEEEAEE